MSQAISWTVEPLAYGRCDLWSEWQALAGRYHAANPMLDAVFVMRLVDHFGARERLHLLTGSAATGVVLLALVKQVGLGQWALFHPSQAQAALLVCAPDIEIDPASVCAAFPRACWKLDLFALDPREHGPLWRDAASPDTVPGAHDICIEVDGDFGRYWAQRPRNLRRNHRRYRNRVAAELGALHCRVHTAVTEIAAATDRYGTLESQGWKGGAGTALHPENAQGAFYRDLMMEMARQQRARVYELYANGTLVASRLCVLGAEMLVILKTTHHESYRRFAVGRLLLHDLVEDVFERRLAGVIDFYTNATPAQQAWATSSRTMVHRSLYSSGVARLLIDGMRRVQRLARRQRAAEREPESAGFTK